MKTQPEPEVTDADVRRALALAALRARALDGDIDAAIWFLTKHGEPKLQLRGADLERNDLAS